MQMLKRLFRRHQFAETDIGKQRYVAPKDGVIPAEFISIPVKDIAGYAIQYAHDIETGVTEHWCKCPWQTHPDDINLQPKHCRECWVHVSEHPTPAHPDYTHSFRAARKRRMDDHPECPQHTKEGYIITFFDWVMQQ